MSHSQIRRRALSVVALACLLLVLPTAAPAHKSSKTGGASAPVRPVLTKLYCEDKDEASCARGETLTIRGHGFEDASSVSFLGSSKSGRDNRRARPRKRSPHKLTVRVPSRARSGRVRVRGSRSGSSRSKLRVLIRSRVRTTRVVSGSDRIYAGGQPAVFEYRAAAAAAGTTVIAAVRTTDGAAVASWPVQAGAGSVSWDGTQNGAPVATGNYVFRVIGLGAGGVLPTSAARPFDVVDAIFPIRAKHEIGGSRTNGFGGGRGHQGQDVFAKCGRRLVAARAGAVSVVDRHSAAGNFVVITGIDGSSYVYMHMRRPSPLRKGDRVLTGQTVGEVGDTGRASGCHLHFERWTAPGWNAGGKPVDPLPELEAWDEYS